MKAKVERTASMKVSVEEERTDIYCEITCRKGKLGFYRLDFDACNINDPTICRVTAYLPKLAWKTEAIFTFVYNHYIHKFCFPRLVPQFKEWGISDPKLLEYGTFEKPTGGGKNGK